MMMSKSRRGRRITLDEARTLAFAAMDLTDRLLREDRDRETAEYLAAIADLMEQMRPFEELAADTGDPDDRPDPDFYAD